MSLAAGTRLGTYEVIASLGAGGMGEVYRAKDTRLGREVAVKVLPDEVSGEADRVARFEREAKALAALNHPHIATLFGMERDGARHFLVMELVEGETLADRLARDRLPAAEALAIARQMADALETAHERGIVHRDLKPANVKVTPDDAVKVLDFGLAKALDSGPGSTPDLSQSPTLSVMGTGAGVILGTAAYMSPEQAKDCPSITAPSGVVTGRCAPLLHSRAIQFCGGERRGRAGAVIWSPRAGAAGILRFQRAQPCERARPRARWIAFCRHVGCGRPDDVRHPCHPVDRGRAQLVRRAEATSALQVGGRAPRRAGSQRHGPATIPTLRRLPRTVSKKWYNYFVVTEGAAEAAADPARPGAAPTGRPAQPQRVVDVVPDAEGDATFSTPVETPTDLGEIYASAQIPAPSHGYTVLKVAEMLQSEHLKALPADVKHKSILVALEAAGVKVAEIVEDAVQRDRALDTYERVLQKNLESLRSQKDEENKAIEQEINTRVAELRAKMDQNAADVKREQDSLLAWRVRKRLEEDRIAEAVGHFVSPNPISTTSTSTPSKDKGGANVR